MYTRIVLSSQCISTTETNKKSELYIFAGSCRGARVQVASETSGSVRTMGGRNSYRETDCSVHRCVAIRICRLCQTLRRLKRYKGWNARRVDAVDARQRHCCDER